MMNCVSSHLSYGCLARSHLVSHSDEDVCTQRQEDLNPRAESNQTESLALLHLHSLLQPADNPPRNQARDLNRLDLPPILRAHHDGISLVEHRGLVQICR